MNGADLEPLLPQGTKIAFTGGLGTNDHAAIRADLDRVHRKHADVVLLHGGALRGAGRYPKISRRGHNDGIVLAPFRAVVGVPHHLGFSAAAV